MCVCVSIPIGRHQPQTSNRTVAATTAVSFLVRAFRVDAATPSFYLGRTPYPIKYQSCHRNSNRFCSSSPRTSSNSKVSRPKNTSLLLYNVYGSDMKIGWGRMYVRFWRTRRCPFTFEVDF